MLLGEAFDDLKQSNYIQSMEEQNYRLEDLKSGNTMKTFLLDSAQFLIQKQEI
jgi:hypothetical protein